MQFSGQYWTGGGDGQLGIRTSAGTFPLTAVQTLLGTGPFEGVDVANLGSQGMAGTHVVTFAAGIHIPVHENVTLSTGYEFAITDTDFLTDKRITTQVSVEF